MKTTFTAEPLTQQEQNTYNALYESYSNGGPVFNNDEYRAFRETLERSDPRLTTNYIRDTIGFRNGMDPAVSQSKNYLTNGKLGANPASSSNPVKANYLTAKDTLEQAKNNLGYATDPMQEQQLRKELQMAQIAYDAAKEEFAKSKLQEAEYITESQAAGTEPITTKNGRKYEGVGNKAQNPERAAEREAEITQAKNALETAKTNMAYVTDEVSEAEARKALNEAQAAYDKAMGKHIVSDEERVGLVGKGAVKGYGADMINAAATTAAGFNQLGQKLGGDTGEYAGWATDEVSRAAIPKQDDPAFWENQRKEVENIQAVSDRLATSSQADIEKAKEGTKGITKLAVDIGSNAIQMGMDGLAAVLTGGTSLAAMGARSMGGAAREARNDGASIAQQVAYGVVRGGIEVLTEKMFDGLAGLYGKGAADDIVESVIGKMAKSDLGRTALRGLFSGLGEAVEEGVSGVTEPLTQAIYKGIQSIPAGYNKEQASEVLYSMLVGFAMGGAGGAVNIITGGNAQSNAALREAEAQRNVLAENAVQRQNSQPVNPITDIPKNGRTYEGIGQKAQNPDKVAAQTESTIVNTNPEEHTHAEQEIIEAYQNAVDETLKDAFEEAYNNPNAEFSRYKISDVSERQAADASRILGGDYAGYTNNINTNEIKHILKRHGPDGEHDTSLADLNDAARIGYVLDNYDGVELGTYEDGEQRFSNEILDKNNQNAPTLKFSKKVNGTYYVVEAIPESKWKKFWIVTAYMQKGDVTQAPNVTSPENTSENVLASPSSDGSISQEEPVVNSNPEGTTTPSRTYESVQAELNPMLKEMDEIDKAIEDTITERNRQMTEAPNSDERVIIKGQAQQVINTLKADKAKLQKQIDALQREQRSIRSSEIAAEKQRLSEGRENKGAKKIPNPQPETHIDNRTAESVGERNVNAFQYDNPEVKPFFKRAAEILRRDLGYMQSSMRSEYGNGTVYGASNQFLEKVRSYFGTTNEAIEACEQIIYDKGRENFADPKRIELFLDEMLSNGYTPVDPSLPPIQASADYLNLKGQLQGGTQYDPRAKAIQAEIDADFTGEMTEEEAAQIVDERKARVGYYDDYTRDGQEDTSLNEGKKPFEEIDAEDTARMEEKYGKKTSSENAPEPPTESTPTSGEESTQENAGESSEEPTQNTTTEETWSGDEVPTQSTFHNQLTDEEKARDELNPDNDTHVQHHDEEVDSFAKNRISEKGHEGAREDLMSRNPAEWDDVDVRTAQMLLEEELENARKLTGEAQDEAYLRIAQLKNAYNKQGTEAGRSLRQRQRFGGSKTEIVSEAANILYGEENKGKTRKLSPEQKSAIMQQVDEFSTRLENAKQSDVASIKDIIMQVAKVRKTSGFLDFGQGKLSKIIDAVSNMEGGMDFLRQVATTQIRSIAFDQIKSTGWEKAKALRYMNMLSNPATASRNVGANTVFGNFIDAISSNLSSPIDAMMSIATGQRSVRNERLSKAALKGSLEAGLKSWLEISLDAEAEQSTYAYNEIKGRTFKANGNFIERILSTLERNQGYQLKTTDQIAKGGIAAETKRNLMKGGMDAETAEALAQEEAKYRTLQNNSGISKAAQKAREALNVVGIKDKNGKTVYGLGDDLLPFAQVPANVVQTELNLNPLSVIPAIGKVFNVMAKGSNATAQEQRAAAKAFGSAVNGTALVVAAALASAKGIIRYTDDDDKDQKQLHKAQGKSGLQINFSAFGRLFSGGDPAEQEGDKWGSIGWIPQINSLFIIGNMVYEDYKDMPEHKDLADWAKFSGKVGLDSLKGMYESILEFPAVSTITSMYNAAKYANVPDDATDSEKLGIQIGSILADKAANTLTGFTIPNALRATAAGLDDTERNLYTADNQLLQAIDSVKAGIPDNPLIPKEYTRGSLPAQTDNLGNPIKNEGGYQQFLNKVILPGAITTDNDNALLEEIDRVAMASGNPDAIPDKNGAYTVTYNGEKLRLTAEEREEYHKYAGKKSEEYIKSFIGSSLYQDMDDDQRAETMAKLNQQAKSEANKHYLETHGKEGIDKLTEGKDAPGTSNDYTPLNKSNIANYYAYETMMKDAIDAGDYQTIDSLTRKYGSLNTNLQTVLSERDDSLRQILKWSDAGIGSETYYKFKDATIASQKKLDKSARTGSVVELDALASMDIPEAEKRKIINNVADVGSKTVVGVYNILADYGYNSKQINDFWTMSQDWVYKDGGSQSSQKAGTLQPLEAAYAIQKLPGLSDAQRSDIYLRMKEVANVPYAINDWKNYTYGTEVNYLTSGRSNQVFGSSNNNNPLLTGQQSTGQQSQNYNQLLKALGLAG